MTSAPHQQHEPVDLAVLGQVEQRVLWLATRIVDAANHDRDHADGVKVGGHQASSASLVSVMTALYFAHLDAADRVSVKPHPSPVLHAISYLLGRLERSYLPTLRAFGGLQSYPSRTKDPDQVDFSTGSVGLGAAAPLFAAVTRRYVDAHFGQRPRTRFVALMGDAELDEGNVWEAVGDPISRGLGNVMWVVDVNRQSLDRVVPGIRIAQLAGQFAAAGWHVEQVKYGRRLAGAFGRSGGEALRAWIDELPNEHYQSLFGLAGDELRARFGDGAPPALRAFVSGLCDEDLRALVTDLGGHDLGALLAAFRRCDAERDRPSVVFAYTVKGWGLPMAGDPMNHSVLLTSAQIDVLRRAQGLTLDTEWDGFDPDTAAGRLVAGRAEALGRDEPAPHPAAPVPAAVGERGGRKPVSTQETFGRVIAALGRDPALAPYLVTTSPDVAVSTNLAGWINKVGVFAPAEVRDFGSANALLKWRESPAGQHLELGISEMNLFLLLGQLGLAWDLSGQPLLPIGTVYDPFVCRGLDAFIYSTYSGARFVLAGTPSGVTLAPEGGAHQSTITASLGLELPGVTLCEPAYAGALDWLLCDALRRVAQAEGSTYLRLSTRALDQAPFHAAADRLGEEALRAAVLAGGYELRPAGPGQPVVLAASGPVLPEVLGAAELLAGQGIAPTVLDVTSLDRLYTGWRHGLRSAVREGRFGAPSAVELLLPAGVPIVTVHDAASHAMAWLGSVHGVPCVPLGVDEFGQSGTVADLYRAHDLDAAAVARAAHVALSL